MFSGSVDMCAAYRVFMLLAIHNVYKQLMTHLHLHFVLQISMCPKVKLELPGQDEQLVVIAWKHWKVLVS